MIHSENTDKVIPAFGHAQAQAGYSVAKDSDNPFFKSRYASLEAVMETIVPTLEANGLTIFHEFPPRTNAVTGEIVGVDVEVTLLHTSGQWLRFGPFFLPSPAGKQNTAQGYLALQTYGRRGTINAIFALATPDDDGNAASGKADSGRGQ